MPERLEYPDLTLYQAIAAAAARAPSATAWDFFDTTATYRELLSSIDRCAAALRQLGLRPGSRPQARSPCLTA